MPSVPLRVQLPQVASASKWLKAVPSGREPVRISCRFGVSVRPLTGCPFSEEARAELIANADATGLDPGLEELGALHSLSSGSLEH